MTNFLNNLLFVFQRLNWLSVLDILLVTLIFFVILYSLRDTQAMVLLRGVIFLVVATLDEEAFKNRFSARAVDQKQRAPHRYLENLDAILRIQEHYESSRFRSRVFTLEEYMDWYAERFGAFTYFEDWSGFNVPSTAFEPFYEGRFDPLSEKERRLLRLFERERAPFYVIGITSDDDLQHELAHALYFTRAPVPYARQPGLVRPLRHVGIYVFRHAFLQRYARLAPTPLEQTERLEQLRALEHGIRIRVLLTPHGSIGVDTPADIDRLAAHLASRGSRPG